MKEDLLSPCHDCGARKTLHLWTIYPPHRHLRKQDISYYEAWEILINWAAKLTKYWTVIRAHCKHNKSWPRNEESSWKKHLERQKRLPLRIWKITRKTFRTVVRRMDALQKRNGAVLTYSRDCWVSQSKQRMAQCRRGVHGLMYLFLTIKTKCSMHKLTVIRNRQKFLFGVCVVFKIILHWYLKAYAEVGNGRRFPSVCTVHLCNAQSQWLNLLCAVLVMVVRVDAGWSAYWDSSHVSLFVLSLSDWRPWTHGGAVPPAYCLQLTGYAPRY